MWDAATHRSGGGETMGTLGRAIYTVGYWIRGTGQAIDRLGCCLQGNYLFQEQLSRHRALMNIFDEVPKVHKDVFVAPSASVIGDVEVGHRSSIQYGCVPRVPVLYLPRVDAAGKSIASLFLDLWLL